MHIAGRECTVLNPPLAANGTADENISLDCAFDPHPPCQYAPRMNKPFPDEQASRAHSRQLATLVSLAIVVPLGFGTKFYDGPAAGWVHGELGGFFYELFWCLAALLVWPRTRPVWLAVSVLGMTCALEFLQLWHPPLLEWLRSFFIGRTIIGNTFSWWDFPYYFLGAGAGWFWMRRLTPRLAG